MSHDRSRRQLLLASSGLGATALLAREARAQTPAAPTLPDFPAGSAGERHRQAMRRAGEVLQGHSPLSEEGMTLLVAELERQGAVSVDEAFVLRGLARILFKSDELGQMRAEIDRLLDALSKDASDTTVVVIEIARDSVRLAAETLDGLPWQTIVPVIASDVSGSIYSAGAAVGWFGPAAAKYGALLGGAAGSVLRYYDLKDRQKTPA